jgi:hypothetical protein
MGEVDGPILPAAPFVEVILAVPADGAGLESLRQTIPVGDWVTLGVRDGTDRQLHYGALALSAEVRNPPSGPPEAERDDDCPVSHDDGP